MTSSPVCGPLRVARKAALLPLLALVGVAACTPPGDAATRSPAPALSKPAAPAASDRPVSQAEANRDFIREWPDQAEAAPVRFVVDGLELTLTTEPSREDSPAIPHLKVRAPNGAVGELVGTGGLNRVAATVAVGRLDERRATQDVMLSTYTGGAHCCNELKVLSLAGGRWRELDFGTRDGEPLDAFPKDRDGDGVSEIEVVDNNFLYTFTSYAGSYAPPQFLVARDGEVVDVSAEPRFRPEFEAYAVDAKAACLAHSNAACAAFVAAEARLDRFAAAWKLMEAAYDRQDDWPLPSACLDPAPQGRCPADREHAFKGFPDALRWFLIDTGYVTADALHWSRGRGPSFDCAKARGMILTLVCTTPELAAADRAMAAAYAAAPADLKRGQRAWLDARDKAAPDASVLLEMYRDRIVELGAAAPR